MKVSDVGEFGLIDIIAKMVAAAQDNRTEATKQLILGIGDDAAAWQGDTSIQLVTTDAMIQDVHFTLNMASWEEIGWRALAANLSDIAAMGGLPRYALISLAFPNHTEVADITALYRGMLELARQFETAIIGGNLSRAPLLVINITILGTTNSQEPNLLTRSTAKPGEKIAITGYLGAAAAGLEVLTKNHRFDAETTTSLKRAFLHPYPRIAEGRLLLAQGVRTAIDISDGLVLDLNHICQASQVGARIEIDRLPIHPTVTANFGERALELALSGGEDYELLFTAGDEIIDKVKTATSCPISIIGEIIPDKTGKIRLVDGKGNLISPPQTGWEHFITR